MKPQIECRARAQARVMGCEALADNVNRHKLSENGRKHPSPEMLEVCEHGHKGLMPVFNIGTVIRPLRIACERAASRTFARVAIPLTITAHYFCASPSGTSLPCDGSLYTRTSRSPLHTIGLPSNGLSFLCRNSVQHDGVVLMPIGAALYIHVPRPGTLKAVSQRSRIYWRHSRHAIPF